MMSSMSVSVTDARRTGGSDVCDVVNVGVGDGRTTNGSE